MSEVRRGIIEMPLHLAMSSELSRMQFHACAQGLYAEKKRLTEQVAALQAAPDSWQSGYDEGRKMGTRTALSERQQLKAELDNLADLKAYVTIPLRERCAQRLALQAEVKALREQLADNELQARADAAFEDYCREQQP